MHVVFLLLTRCCRARRSTRAIRPTIASGSRGRRAKADRSASRACLPRATRSSTGLATRAGEAAVQRALVYLEAELRERLAQRVAVVLRAQAARALRSSAISRRNSRRSFVDELRGHRRYTVCHTPCGTHCISHSMCAARGTSRRRSYGRSASSGLISGLTGPMPRDGRSARSSGFLRTGTDRRQLAFAASGLLQVRDRCALARTVRP